MLGFGGHAVGSVDVPKELLGKVIGKGQATKLDIESDYKVHLDIPSKNDASTTIKITGPNNEAVECARARILDICGLGRNGDGKLRAKLDALFREKDELFRRAHQASGAQREALMQQANAKKAEADALQRKIGDDVFAQKNRGYGLDQMDLHGLTVAQAEDKVRERLRKVDADLKSGRLPTLTIIVGQGIHSEGHAKIKPAIEELLRQSGYNVQVDEAGGQFFVSGAPAAATAGAGAPPKSLSQLFDDFVDFFVWCFGGGRK